MSRDASAKRDYIAVPPHVIHHLATLGGAELAVLLVLCKRRDWNTDALSETMAAIGEAAGGMHAKSVGRAVAKLEAVGLIKITSGDGRRNATTFRVIFDADGEAETGAPLSTFEAERGAQMSTFGEKGERRCPQRGAPLSTFEAERGAPLSRAIRSNQLSILNSSSTLSPAAPSATDEKPAKGARVKPADVDAIYAAYPLKKKPNDAERAIGKALDALSRRPAAELGDMTPADWLLARTTAFAAARERCFAAGTSEPRFTPYPATWFNARSYDEDPATWEPSHTRATNGTKTFRKGPNDGLARGIGKLPKGPAFGRDSGDRPGGGAGSGDAANGRESPGGVDGG